MIPVYIVALLAFLVLVTLIVLRLPPLLSAVLWVTVPLALTPLWLDNADSYQWTWFLWLKTWTIMVACAWGALCCALPRIPLRLVASRSRH